MYNNYAQTYRASGGPHIAINDIHFQIFKQLPFVILFTKALPFAISIFLQTINFNPVNLPNKFNSFRFHL